MKEIVKSFGRYECLYCLTRGDALSATHPHTSGPWIVHGYTTNSGNYNKALDVGPQGKAVATVIGAFDEATVGPECEANARLIAAAPDLLEALKAVMGGQLGAGANLQAERFQKARAAIAKATLR